MAKAAKGYLANDGSFFSSKEAAELHDSQRELEDKIADSGFPEDISRFIIQNRNFILKFIKDLEAYEKRNISDPANAD